MNMLPNQMWEKKLPPFSGLVLVAVLFLTITYLTSNVVLFGTKAATGGVPKKVQVTNISDTSFTVTYQTDEPVLGSVGYGTNESLGNVSLDDRDQVTNKAIEHRIHHITIKNLTPGSKYVFAISSGGETYKNNNALYETITAPTLTTKTSTQPPLKGQVTLDDGSIPVEGIVEASTDTSQTFTALLKPDGSYEVPLQTIRMKDLTDWAPLTTTTQLHVTISDPTKQSTAVLLADQVNPAPLMVLNKNYDFSADDSLNAETQATGSATSPIDLTVPVDTTQVTSPKITSPKSEQAFNDLQPMFEGKALPNTEVAITIQSQQIIEATVQSDPNGNWQFRPTVPLDPGKHLLTIKSPDSQGALQSISQSFTVFAQGSQFIEPSISPPVLPTPVLVPTVAASASPTLALSPSPAITSEPTPTFASLSPSPGYGPNDPNDPNNPNNWTNPNSPYYRGNTDSTTPPTGSSDWIIGLAGLLLTAGIGTFLFFFI